MTDAVSAGKDAGGQPVAENSRHSLRNGMK